MKKKRNLLTIISSILGVFVICGAFCCSLFIGSNKKATQSKAAYNLVGLASFDFSYRFSSTSMTDYWLFIEGNVNAYQLYGDNGYHYEYVFNTRYKLYSISNDTYYPVYKFSSDLGTGIAYTFVTSVSEIYSQEHHDYIPIYNYDEYFDVRISGFQTSGIDLFTGLQTINIGVGESGDVNGTLPLGLGVANVYCDVVLPEYAYIVIDPSVLLGRINLNISVDDPYSSGYSDGYELGKQDGYANGVGDGYSSGYQVGYDDGYNLGYSYVQSAYDEGYAIGFNDGFSADDTVVTIFSGILQVALVPINFFLAIFNFEILGINLSAFIKALFTVVITVIVLKTVIGGGSNDN